MNQHHCPNFPHLSNKNTRTTGSLDLSLSFLAEELGLDDDGHVRKSSVSQNLVESSLGHINNGSLSVRSRSSLSTNILRHECPKLGQVECRFVSDVVLQMEPSHSDLSEITRMVLIEQNTVMMLTSSVTTSTRMLSVFTCCCCFNVSSHHLNNRRRKSELETSNRLRDRSKTKPFVRE